MTKQISQKPFGSTTFVPRRGGRNFGLDLFRATAISLVVASHYTTLAPVCGILGVELFFVLSGFLIGGILYKAVLFQEQTSFRELQRFWVRRWMRTLPNYYLFFVVALVLPFLITDGSGAGNLARRYLLLIQNFAWPAPAFYGVSWSLAVEKWFYLLFPALFFCLYRLIGKRPCARRVIFLVVVAFFFILSLALRGRASGGNNWPVSLRMVVVYRFDSLMFGVMLACVQIENIFWWNLLQKLLPINWLRAVCHGSIHRASIPAAGPANLAGDVDSNHASASVCLNAPRSNKSPPAAGRFDADYRVRE